MQQIYRRTPTPKCDSSKVAKAVLQFYVHLLETLISIFLQLFYYKITRRLFIEYGSRSNKKGCWLKDSALNEVSINALLGLHPFSGSDFVSSFFGNESQNDVRYYKTFSKFADCFSQLGAELDLSDALFNELEENAIYMNIVKRILTKFDVYSSERNMQKKAKSLACKHYHLTIMLSE